MIHGNLWINKSGSINIYHYPPKGTTPNQHIWFVHIKIMSFDLF